MPFCLIGIDVFILPLLGALPDMNISSLAFAQMTTGGICTLGGLGMSISRIVNEVKRTK